MQTVGTITTQNLSVGTQNPTAGSFLQLLGLPSGTQSVGLSVTNTYSGALTPSGTTDGIVWTALTNSPLVAQATGLASNTIPSGATGIYTVNVAGLLGFRLDAQSSVTGEADVSVFSSLAPLQAPTGNSSLWCLTAAVPQSGSDTVVKASAGYLLKVITTSSGSAATPIYDNATTHTGTILFTIPASPGIGTIYYVNAPAVNGLTVKGAASESGITVFYY